MEIANRVGLELIADRPFAFHFRQSGDTVTLETAMQRGASQLRNRRLQGIQAVIEEQQRVLAKCHNHCLLIGREYR